MSLIVPLAVADPSDGIASGVGGGVLAVTGGNGGVGQWATGGAPTVTLVDPSDATLTVADMTAAYNTLMTALRDAGALRIAGTPNVSSFTAIQVDNTITFEWSPQPLGYQFICTTIFPERVPPELFIVNAQLGRYQIQVEQHLPPIIDVYGAFQPNGGGSPGAGCSTTVLII